MRAVYTLNAPCPKREKESERNDRRMCVCVCVLEGHACVSVCVFRLIDMPSKSLSLSNVGLLPICYQLIIILCICWVICKQCSKYVSLYSFMYILSPFFIDLILKMYQHCYWPGISNRDWSFVSHAFLYVQCVKMCVSVRVCTCPHSVSVCVLL